MAYKILMLGGKRAGKSTVLATILHTLDNVDLNGCRFSDSTSYPQFVTNTKGEEVAIPTLNAKRIEIEEYLRGREGGAPNSKFLVDMSSSIGKCEYDIQSSVGRLDFTFVDVPGEWMIPGTHEFTMLKNEISETDIFIITIDTPYLMKMRDRENYHNNLNDVYNRIADIRNALKAIDQANNILDKKLILFCPVKCEKWINEGAIEEVINRVNTAYSGIINEWIDRNIGMWILPIQTAGGIESYKLLTAMKVFNTEKQQIGEKCSIENGIVIYPMGNTVREDKVFRIEEDAAQTIDCVHIPHSWYKTNGKGFAPKDCEQVLFQVLKFLVEKETLIMQNKKKEWEGFNWWQRLWKRKPPFGKFLPQYQNLITEIVAQGKIKENKDGFVRVTKIKK